MPLSTPNPNPNRSALARLSNSAFGRATGRITRGFSSLSSVRFAGRVLRYQLWIWPILAAAILGAVGYFVHHSVEQALRTQRENGLTTILNADVEALRVWITEQGRNAELIAEDDKIKAFAGELLALDGAEADLDRQLLQAPAQSRLRERLAPRIKSLGYHGFFLVSPSGRLLAAEQDSPVGKPLNGHRAEFFEKVRIGGPSVSKPFRSQLLLRDHTGEFRANLPSMFAAAPLKSDDGKPIATLGLRIRPEAEFTRILQIAQSGRSGETYAFDDKGLFLSSSRFDDELKSIGLLADLPESQSVLTLQARDPGVDLADGRRPAAPRSEQPLTHMAEEATAGRSGCDPDGYRNYRGISVVGAWTWLPDYDFGVVTEIESEEAFAPTKILRQAFWGLLVLLGLAAIGIFLAMLFLSRQQRQLQAAVLRARQLGQYTLENPIGSGGMGTVYKARHAMLRRPTALKLLDLDKLSPTAAARFEREVQATSTLTHPNTIQIFDFGRTPEGIFYYAMELLDGADLDALVARFGPLPEARAVYLLRQACGSLAEAHAEGLVHRDVKPANLYLTRRGGMRDFIKVLDFGLVKAVVDSGEANLTSANVITGTPYYISPEAVSNADTLDARADVYALGAVAYHLLTGRPPFEANTVVEIVMKHMNEPPVPPSVRSGRPISPELEALILRCLAKDRAERPADAGVLLRELDRCRFEGVWTRDDAELWWANHSFNAAVPNSPMTSPATEPQFNAGQTMDYKPR